MKTPRQSRDRRRLRRRLVWLVLAIAAIVAVAATLVVASPDPEVEVAPVTRGRYVRFVEEDGRARVRDRYVVSAPVTGTLERVTLSVGDEVAAGEVVALLRPAPSPLLDARSRAELEENVGAAEARIAVARAETGRADAAFARAEADLSRARRLAASGTIAQQALEAAEHAWAIASRERDGARHAAHAAEHELGRSRAALEATEGGLATGIELRAPVGGRVLSVRQESEAVVLAGTSIVELGDPRALEVVVDLLSTDAVLVEPGSAAEIAGWGGSALRATVRSVQPIASVRLSALGVEEERVDVVVDPLETSDRWARVGDGYRVDVRIALERFEDVLRVPTSALHRAGDEWRVFAVRDGIATAVPVEVGSYGPIESVIARGLRERDLVIVQPPETLRDGDAVETRLDEAHRSVRPDDPRPST
jgi:HlyD family secretion protein